MNRQPREAAKKLRRSKRKWKRDEKARKRGRPSRIAQAYIRAQNGVIWVTIPANIPRKPNLASDNEQAAWIKQLFNERDADVVTVAEAHPGLIGELRRKGLFVVAANPNPGGARNVIVLRGKPKGQSSYPISYRTIHGNIETLHQARAVVRKGLSKTTHDAIHVPPRGTFTTSAYDPQREEFIRAIARRRAPTKSRQVSGDWNGSKEWVLRHLQEVDERWRYIGGRGVEMTFGINTRDLDRDDKTIEYGNKSDHHHTAEIMFGVPFG